MCNIIYMKFLLLIHIDLFTFILFVQKYTLIRGHIEAMKVSEVVFYLKVILLYLPFLCVCNLKSIKIILFDGCQYLVLKVFPFVLNFLPFPFVLKGSPFVLNFFLQCFPFVLKSFPFVLKSSPFVLKWIYRLSFIIYWYKWTIRGDEHSFITYPDLT